MKLTTIDVSKQEIMQPSPWPDANDGLESQSASIRLADLPLLYGRDFPEWEQLWLERMNSRGTGLSILSDIVAGTGQTQWFSHNGMGNVILSKVCLDIKPKSDSKKGGKTAGPQNRDWKLKSRRPGWSRTLSRNSA